MIAIAMHSMVDSGFHLPAKGDSLDYDLVVPMMLSYYFPTGMLGIGLTALMASFISGMAGNVTAFNTVFTYDIYQSYIKKDGSDKHYLNVGCWTTVFGILFSMGAAYFAATFNNIMDVLQLVFAFVDAPLFATFLLGMFWRRTTGHAAFTGHGRRRHPPRPLTAGKSRGRNQGRLALDPACLPERNGVELLDGDLGMERLFRDHHPRLARDQTHQDRRRTVRLGLLAHGKDQGARHDLLETPGGVRHRGAPVRRRPQHPLFLTLNPA
jgi:hypothetical protein